MKLRYVVIDKETDEIIKNSSVIVTQDGKVAWWDDGQGWQEAEDQSRYIVATVHEL